MPSTGHFYGSENGNKLFKIYITPGALCGAKIAGQVYDAKSARIVTRHFGLLGFALSAVIGARYAKKRTETEAKYDAMETGGPVFMSADKANFSLGPSSISKIEINARRPGLKNIFKSEPAVEIHLTAGKKRRFVLIGEQDVEYIRSLVSKVVPATTIVE